MQVPSQTSWASVPALRLLLCYIVGVIIGRYIILDWYLYIIFLGFSMLWFLMDVYCFKSLNRLIQYGITISYLILIVILGITRYDITKPPQPSPMVTYFQNVGQVNAKIKGVITTVYKRTKNVKLFLNTSEIQLNENIIAYQNINIILDCKKNVCNQFQQGDKITADIIIKPISVVRNPGAFNEKNYMAYQKIDVKGTFDKLYEHKKFSMWTWYSIRNYMNDWITQITTPSTKPIALTMLIGDRSEITYQTRKAFSRVGLAHIMAVSGLHVGILLGPWLFFMPMIRKKHRWLQIVYISFIVVFLLLYCGLVQFSPSVIRASIMALLFMIGYIFKLRIEPLNIVSFVALLMLIYDPHQLFDIGFQLSFAAVYIIFLTLPILQRIIPYTIRQKWYGKTTMTFCISTSLAIGLSPFLQLYFGEWSIISPFTNIAFSIVIIYIETSLFYLSFLASFLPHIALLLNTPANLLIDLLQYAVNEISQWHGTWVHGRLKTFTWFAVITMLFLSLYFWIYRNIRWKMIILFLLTLTIHSSYLLYLKWQNYGLKIIVFDVGQGDSSLITLPNGKHILIDSGKWSLNTNSAKTVLLPYFEYKNINHIEAIIHSHPHSDHIGGTNDILSNIRVNKIYNSGLPYTSKIYKQYIETANNQNTMIKALKAGETINLDDNVHIQVLAPEINENDRNVNNHSVVIRMDYGECSFLFTGDTEEESEREIVQRYHKLLDVDFLKVGHHGSKTSSTEEFMKAVTPQIAIASMGYKNKYYHPHKSSIIRLTEYSETLYLTARDKAKIFFCDGKTIKEQSW